MILQNVHMNHLNNQFIKGFESLARETTALTLTNAIRTFEGWISDMESDGLTFVPKVANFYSFRSRFVSKSWLFIKV